MFSVANASKNEALEHFQNLMSQYFQFSGAFSQTTRTAEGEAVMEQEGLFMLQQPNKLYWKTKQPWEQLLVSNGQHIWLYDKDLEQVVIRSASDTELQQTPAMLLFGNTQIIESHYKVQYVATTDNEQIFIFTPQEQMDNQQLPLGISRIVFTFTENAPGSIEFDDALQQRTIIKLKQLSQEQTIDTSIFEFQIPEGTEVITQ